VKQDATVTKSRLTLFALIVQESAYRFGIDAIKPAIRFEALESFHMGADKFLFRGSSRTRPPAGSDTMPAAHNL
jgi:hypothetical protein